jgi:HK97 family phage prohead protease
MPLNLLSADDFRTAAKDGALPEGMVFRLATSEPETIGETDSRVKRFVFSDSSVDLAGDVIKQDGWDLKNFERNPVALFSHASWAPPIGRASNVSVKNGKLVGDIEFADADTYPFADTIFRLVDGGYLRAVSVGFMPKEWVFTNDKNRPFGIDFKKQSLCEISVCALPCNPNALQEARSLGGIDTSPLVEWAEKVLDTGEIMFLPRKELETLRTQAKGAEPAQYYVQGDREATAKGIERMRESYKRWREDPNELLLLEPGFKLRSVETEASAPVDAGDAEVVEATETDEPIEADQPLKDAAAEVLKAPTQEGIDLVGQLAAKAGRRISAATKAKMQAALDMADAHHEAITKCITEAMGSDQNDPDDPDDATVQDADIPAHPPGTVVLESDEHLTPEERRLKEVTALKASLPTND